MHPENDPELFDISPLIHAKAAVFPGDTPFRQEFLLHTAKGDNLTLSTIHTTTHIGAHTDAPSHYAAKGATIEARSLRLYLGRAQVIEVATRPGTRITLADVAGKKFEAPRVLFKTRSFPNPDVWNDDFTALSAELIHALHHQGVRLIGIDTPSIDPADDKFLESHNAVAANDMAILEGIVLDVVPEGLYELIALPLRIKGGDASPVRAVLLKT